MTGGFILVNKQEKITSSGLDRIIKKHYPNLKVGHLGTLDPLAEGLLIVMIGEATKTAKFFDDLSKTYELKVRIGATSSSLDYETECVVDKEINLENKEDELDRILESFVGEYLQYPPLYSAIKLDGMPLYFRAHRGLEAQIKPRKVKCFSIERVSPIIYKDNSSFFNIILTVSKGFYLRSLARDIAHKFGTEGMSAYIKRLEIGPFKLENSFTVDEIIQEKHQLINPLNYLSYEKVIFDNKLIKKVMNGQRLETKYFKSKSRVKILDESGDEVAIYSYDERGFYALDFLVKK